MALKIRKGLEADRLDITPAEAEPIYVTDTKKVYIGDGTTAGGNSLSTGGESGIKHSFSWGDVSSTLIETMDTGVTITAIYFIVQEVFDGVGATVTIGTVADPDLLMGVADVDLTSIGTYLVSPGYKFAAETEVKIFNTPGSGASTGAGSLVINS